ncbi:MAG: Imm8 family immunity protein [Ginsengibacter sp.]
MMRYFVHDYLIEETSANKIKDCFLYHISIYCTHKEKWVDEDSEKFYVSVGNPKGIAHHLQILQEVFTKSKHKTFFNGPFMVIANYDEEEIMQLIKEKIESVTGVNKRELLYNLSPYFQWEYLSDPNVVINIFK